MYNNDNENVFKELKQRRDRSKQEEHCILLGRNGAAIAILTNGWSP